LHAADALRAKDNNEGRTRKSPPFGFFVWLLLLAVAFAFLVVIPAGNLLLAPLGLSS